jgi:hypothetical protein
MVTKASGARRPYNPGEDRAKERDGFIVCQAPAGLTYGRGAYKPDICGKPVSKVGRFRIAGGWHDVYECIREPKHRFGISGDGVNRARTVIDIAVGKPVFGEQ